MSSFSVVTSIYPPTDAVRRLAGLDGYELVVVGDKKSPPDWSCPGATFLPAAEQAGLAYNVATLLPWNHYCRKMIGYLHAMAHGAEVIFDTDDDNIPKDSWVAYPFTGDYATSRGDQGFVNVYKYFTDMHIWPAGVRPQAHQRPYGRHRDRRTGQSGHARRRVARAGRRRPRRRRHLQAN